MTHVRYFVIGMFVFVLSLVGILIMVPWVPVLANITQNTRSTPASDNLACAVASTATSCDITLSGPHANGTLAQATVMETSPGSADVTANSTLDLGNRRTITVTSLTPSTNYAFTVDYLGRASGIGVTLDQLLRNVPLIFLAVLLICVAVGVAAVLGVNVWNRIGNGG